MVRAGWLTTPVVACPQRVLRTHGCGGLRPTVETRWLSQDKRCCRLGQHGKSLCPGSGL